VTHAQIAPLAAFDAPVAARRNTNYRVHPAQPHVDRARGEVRASKVQASKQAPPGPDRGPFTLSGEPARRDAVATW
jgi:hypothetical protein